jgi:hypothetical protein
MKPYKQICEVDSDRLIVLDENMKEVPFLTFAMKAISFLMLLFLTACGLGFGVSREAVSKKLESIDIWASSPANQLLLSCFILGVLCIGLLTFAMWALLIRKK